jgi:hypothetical protein
MGMLQVIKGGHSTGRRLWSCCGGFRWLWLTDFEVLGNFRGCFSLAASANVGDAGYQIAAFIIRKAEKTLLVGIHCQRSFTASSALWAS